MKRKIVVCCMLIAAILCVMSAGCGSSKAKTYVEITDEVNKVGPYSQVIRANGFVFFTAQVSFALGGGNEIIGKDDVTEQTKQILNNFESELKDAGLTMDSVVQVTVYLRDMKDFEAMNTEYAKHFKEPYPVRACVEVSDLPVEDALLSVQITAVDN